MKNVWKMSWKEENLRSSPSQTSVNMQTIAKVIGK